MNALQQTCMDHHENEMPKIKLYTVPLNLREIARESCRMPQPCLATVPTETTVWIRHSRHPPE